MNTKEKAIELYRYYTNLLHPNTCSDYLKIAKRCAKKDVDEIIKSKPIENNLEYWNEVKKEIDLL